MEQQRESFGSRFGFIMTTVGFSVGLGNIWRFPYLVSQNGGGAFVLIYLAIAILIGIPLFTMEMSIGRKSQASPVPGMRKLTKKGSPWVSFGWLGVIAAFVILTYYIQIMGWIIYYIGMMITGGLSGLTEAGYQGVFDGLMNNAPLLTGVTLVCALIIGIISSKGLEGGLEKVCKVMLPALFIMLAVLAIRSLTLDGAMEGLAWYLKPDFSKVTGSTFIDALGQVFFSIGIASGGGFIYGSYLDKDSDIPGDGMLIVSLDTMVALLAGIVIFPAIFALGMDVDQGASLLFVTMSNLFNQIPLGTFFGFMFFLLIFFAALSSALGYLEPVVMTVREIGGVERKQATWLSLVAIFVVGMLTVLGNGPWSHILIGGRNLFDFADFLSGNIMMPLGAIVLSLYTAFAWKFVNYQAEANVGADGRIRVFDWWKPLVNVLIPIALVIIFISNVL